MSKKITPLRISINCDYIATRYYNSGKGQTESKDSEGQRHDYYRRSMRL